MKAPKGKKAVKKPEKEQIIQVRPLLSWSEGKKAEDPILFEFLNKGEVNLIFGAKTLFKNLFGYWLGIRIAEMVDTVYHLSLSPKGGYASHFKHARVPSNLHKGYILNTHVADEELYCSLKSVLNIDNSNILIIIDSLNAFKRPTSREREAIQMVTCLSRITKELKAKSISLTTIILANSSAPNSWKSAGLYDLKFPISLKESISNIYYFGASSNLNNPNHFYIKQLKPKEFITKILLFELIKELGNYHFKMKAWEDEKPHLSISPEKQTLATLHFIGLLGLATIREKYWDGICKDNFIAELNVQQNQESYIIEIIDTIYGYKSIIPFNHIPYLISDTNISISRFDEVAQKYLNSIGRRYDLQLEGRNIQPIK